MPQLKHTLFSRSKTESVLVLQLLIEHIILFMEAIGYIVACPLKYLYSYLSFFNCPTAIPDSYINDISSVHSIMMSSCRNE